VDDPGYRLRSDRSPVRRRGEPHPVRAALALPALLALLLLASIPIAGMGAAGPSPGSTGAPASSCPQLLLPTPICHVVIVFLENQNESWVLRHAPFQKYLANKYALASQYYSALHFSYPNYVAATSGTETNYVKLHDERNVADLIENTTGGMTWKAYFENMRYPCDNVASGGYRITHNPFVFYRDIWNNQTRCQSHDVSFANYTHDARTGALPNYAFFGPNASHSCWKAGLRVCDPWLRSFVSPMVNSSTFNSTAIFLTYDEGPTNDTSGISGTKGGGHVYTVAVSPYACPGYVSTTQYNPYNLLTTSEWLLGLGRTGHNDSWVHHPPMRDLFCFPNATGGGVGHPPLPGFAPTPVTATFPVATVRLRLERTG
jgi:hypothetical protein